MPSKTQTFRLFISSTFRDFVAERDELRLKVYPLLRQICRAHGANFIPVDLRWGVSQEAAKDLRTMEICFSEIDRSVNATRRPNFLLLMGNRYGYRPAPERIPADEFQKITEVLAKNPTLESQLRELHKWYFRDDNAIDPEYRLKPWSDTLLDHEQWRQDEADLLNILAEAAVLAGFSDERLRRYWASATEQEIAHRGLLKNIPDPGEVIYVFRTINGLPDTEKADDYLEQDETIRDRLKQLKESLRSSSPSSVIEYMTEWSKDGLPKKPLEQFCKHVYSKLSKIILGELESSAIQSPLELEVAAHFNFVRERTSHFVGRQSSREAIQKYLAAEPKYPFVVYGESGSGKSALLGQITKDVNASSETILVYRSVGAVPSSKDIRSLLESICQQLRGELGENVIDTPSEYQELVADFHNLLRKKTPGYRIVVIIDALDQIITRSSVLSLTWLPSDLPPNVHIVVSTTEGPILEAVKSQAPSSYLHQLTAMPSDQTSILLDAWLSDIRRTLQQPQRDLVLNACEAAGGLPLYLRLAYEEARRWASYIVPPKLAPDVPGMIRDLFDRLSSGKNHGKMLVQRILANLVVAKNGLAEDELLDILSADKDVMSEVRANHPNSPKSDSLPIVIWSRLFDELEPYLSRREVDGTYTLEFFHKQLREVIEENYLDAKQRANRHCALAQYFTEMPLKQSADGRSAPQLRKLAELPYQLAYSGKLSELTQLLLNFPFLQTKISAVGPQAVIDDFELALSVSAGSDTESTLLSQIQSALMLASNILMEHPEQLASQLHARLLEQKDPLIIEFLESARPPGVNHWLRPIRQSLPDSSGALMATVQVDNSEIGAVAVTPDNSIAVSGSGKLLVVWDLSTLTRIREIQIEEGTFDRGSDLIVLSDGLTVIATMRWGGTVTAWNLATGNKLWELGKSEGRLEKIGISADEKWLLTGSQSNLIIWNLESHEPYRKISYEFDPNSAQGQFSSGSFRATAISPDGQRVIVSNFKGPVEVWDIETQKRERTLDGCNEEVLEFLFRDNGKQVIAFAAANYNELDVMMGKTPGIEYSKDLFEGEEQTIFVRRIIEWEIDTGNVITNMVFDQKLGSSNAIAIIADTNKLISASNSGPIDVVDLGRTGRLTSLYGHDESTFDLAVYNGGKRAISSSQDRTLKIWNLERIDESSVHANHTNWVTACSFSQNEMLCTSASLDGSAIIWRLSEHGIKADSYQPNFSIQNIHMLPERNKMFVVCYDKTTRVVDLRTFDNVLIDTFKYAERMLGSAVSSDGSTAIVAFQIEDISFEGATFTFGVHVVDLRTKSRINYFSSEDYDQSLVGNQIIFLPGNEEAISARERSVCRWSVKTGEIVSNYQKLWSGELNAIAITPDGSKAFLGIGQSICSLDLNNGSIITLTQDDSTIADMVYCTKNKQLVSVTNSGSVSLWETKEWTRLANFIQDVAITACSISLDENTIAVGDALGRLHMLQIEKLAQASEISDNL